MLSESVRRVGVTSCSAWAVMVLLSLQQAYLDAQRRCHPVPRLTPRQKDLLHLVAAGHDNAAIARRLGLSRGTVRKHLKTSTPGWASLAAAP